VIPEFYTRNKEGFPTAWITRMRESMALLTPRFSANRVVRQYLEEHYVPAAKKYKERVANSATLGDKIVNWGHAINHHWASLRFGELKIKSQDNKFIFEIPFYYNDLDPDYVRIELYANGIDDGEPLRLEMTRLNQSPDTIGSSIYSATVPANRNADDFTVRAIPHCDGVSIPLESTNILWQR
jgi:starch phosphorylase